MKKKLRCLSLLSLCVALGSLAGCSNGAQGNGFLRGSGEPTSVTGINGDTYLDEDTYDLFKKENGAWIKIGNIKGSDGTNGTDGVPGSDGVNGLSAYELYCKYHPVYGGTEEEWINALADGSLAASYKTSYNVIFTVATIPPVLSALDSIRNGNETYAFIERGKTYSGISQLSNWHNIGFNTNSNNSSGFVLANYNDTLDVVKRLNVFGNEHFNIYLQDGNGLYGAYFAANAQLSKNQYDVVMVEDGTGAYNAFKNSIIGNRTCTASGDEIYQNYKEQVDAISKRVDDILSSKDTPIQFYYDIPTAFYLSAVDNFHYWFQDRSQLVNILNQTVTDGTYTKLFDVIGVDKGNAEAIAGYQANLRFESISAGVDSLSNNQKENYLRLMYGNYYEDTYNALTRTTLIDGATAVPAHKLVYVGTRMMGFPKFASNAAYGIGGASSVSDIPSEYSALNAKYKTDFLFENEADYQLFLSTVNNDDNYDTAPTASQKDLVKVSAFNQYINYMFALKYAQKMYGANYDLIIKGHPSEVMGSHENWSRHYTLDGVDASLFNYDKLADQLMLNFHSQDSTGRFIGSVPYGTAAENLAYLGADISICGLPSSTYTGYDTSVPVVFVMSESNGDISSDGNLAARYENGSLAYTNLEGNSATTSFANIGNVYKNMSAYYENHGNAGLSSYYASLLNNWLISTFEEVTSKNVNSYTINEQGTLVSK